MAKLLRATALVFTLALAAPVATAADNRSDAGKTDANHVEGINGQLGSGSSAAQKQ